jgi:hypothetical protein
MLRTVSKYAPPPPGVVPPTLWGVEETVRERFGDRVDDIRMERAHYPSFDYPFPPHEVADWFIAHYGPTHRAHAISSEENRTALRQELADIFSRYNQSTAGDTRLKAEFLRVSVRKR